MASQTQLVSLISLLLTAVTSAASYATTTAHNPSRKPERQTHLRLYWHDIVSGPHPTAVNIVKPPPPKSNSSAPSFFGAVAMIDDPLTVGPDVTSKQVGRAQGLYALSEQVGSGILMVMNFAFMDGEYNGSTIAVMGRNEVANKVREMPVVGGSGVFRFARGYVQARTHTFNLKTGDATVEYNCYYLVASLISLLLSTAGTAAAASTSYKSKEKLSHFRFYWHDIQSGAHPSSVPIVMPVSISSSSTPFGGVNMIDNPMTESPNVTSKLVGRAQGFYGLASQEQLGLIMVMNFAFVEGKYNGSSVTVLGRNMVSDKIREMPVVGGSGLFRFARGYVQARTYSFDTKTRDAVVQYDSSAAASSRRPYKTEKLTHFRVYWHDVQSGAHPTSVPIVKPPSAPSYFGGVNMIDNALTEGPDASSKLVGRAQGLYGVASQEQLGLLMAMNFGFVEGKYNGSSITVMGRNMVFDDVREMPVVGGSGMFRFARGYVQARTHSLDFKTGDAIVEYHCYVMHF
ncbi:hypothetical protein V2J09_001013 [Rumex salicifolius]